MAVAALLLGVGWAHEPCCTAGSPSGDSPGSASHSTSTSRGRCSQSYGLAGALRGPERRPHCGSTLALACRCEHVADADRRRRTRSPSVLTHGPPPEPSRVEMMSTPGACVSSAAFAISWLAAETPTAGVAAELMISAISSEVPDPGPTGRVSWFLTGPSAATPRTCRWSPRIGHCLRSTPLRR